VINWRGQTKHFLDRARDIQQFPPITVMWGDKDRVLPHSQALATTGMLRGATLKTFHGCGHFPHQQVPDEFARALLAFLDAPFAKRVQLAPEYADQNQDAAALNGWLKDLGLQAARTVSAERVLEREAS
jgi:hypothetical protein